MPTLIDSLVIELGLDPAKFNQGQKSALSAFKQTQEEALKVSKNIETFSQRTSHFLGLMRSELIGIGAALLGAATFKSFIGNMVATDAAVSHTARTLGMAGKNLAAWRAAASSVPGGDPTGLQAGFERLRDILEESKFSGIPAELTKWTNRIGIALNPLADTAETVVNKVFRSQEFLRMSMQDQYQVLKSLGLGDEFLKILDAAQHLNISVAEYVRRQGQAAGATEATLKANEELDRRWRGLATRAEGIGRVLESWTIAPLNQGMDILEKLIDDLQKGTGSLGEMWKATKREIDAVMAIFKGKIDLSDFFHVEPGSVTDDVMKFFKWLNSGPGNELARGFVRGLIGPKAEEETFGPSARGTEEGVPGGGKVSSENWKNWLAGQSFLETSYRNEKNPTSSARGYFQFIDSTVAMVTKGGLPNPRAGDYAAQASATEAFIRKFHPDAAAAIDRGDYATATKLLTGEWPSLPGGSQMQGSGRYDEWRKILQGKGLRPPGEPTVEPTVPGASFKDRFEALPQHLFPPSGVLPLVPGPQSSLDNSQTSTTHNNSHEVNIQNMNVTTPDPERFGSRLKPVLEAQNLSVQANFGIA